MGELVDGDRGSMDGSGAAVVAGEDYVDVVAEEFGCCFDDGCGEGEFVGSIGARRG